ncbi:MAG: methyltransferase domain-containing protein [Pseudomonadales bacterium]|nr:methyltransferase domain-containing protein [Pseudomonadales bacterium]
MYTKIVDKEGQVRAEYLDYGTRCHQKLGNKKEAVEFAITWCTEFITKKSVERMGEVITWSNLNSHEPILDFACQQAIDRNLYSENLTAIIQNQRYFGFHWKPSKLNESNLLSTLQLLQDDKLFLWMLKQGPITNISIILFLNTIIRLILERANPNLQNFIDLEPIIEAIAAQCSENDYLFEKNDQDTVNLQILQDLFLSSTLNANDGRICLWIIAMFMPINDISDPETLSALPHIKTQLKNPLVLKSFDFIQTEQKIVDQLTTNTPLLNGDFEQMYLDYPYPKWKELDNIVRNTYQILKFFGHKDEDLRKKGLDILIAGCGTGKHAIEVAIANPDATVVAYDVSPRALAYAIRKQKALNIQNLRIELNDIEHFSASGVQFDIIECVGVLQHTQDIWHSFDQLTRNLKPQGYMRIGIYSLAARIVDSAFRLKLWDQGHLKSGSASEVRTIWNLIAQAIDDHTGMPDRLLSNDILTENRKQILEHKSDAHFYHFEEVKLFKDFYNLHTFADMICARNEHVSSIPEIAEALQARQMKFIGMEHSNVEGKVDPKAYRSFKKLEKLEEKDFRSFANMYTFWCHRE